MTYLEWLREKWVQKEGTDYLLDSIAGMIPVFFDKEHAWRWLVGIRKTEAEWIDKINEAGSRAPDYLQDHLLPLASQQCFSYNLRCVYFDICWRGRTPDTLLEEGTLIPRECNHLQEFYEVM